ncbi:MAG: 3'-5' exonuclease [Chlamydiae bacterium]|nr:3'-5' exonuclease [Chlamydiota bacterium]
MLGIFLDTEANGLNYKKHKLIEIAFRILDMETGEEKDRYESIVFQTFDDWQFSDLDSLQINGFTWEEVSYGKKSETAAQEIQQIFLRNKIQRGQAVFICQNPSFDRAFFAQIVDPDVQEKLLWPYHWLDLASMFWAESMQKAKIETGLLPWQTGFSKDKIAVAYELPGEEKPHRAMNGVNHLIVCYEAVVGFPKKVLSNL